MAINRQDSRHRIKRSTLTGVVPTVPVSSDFTDGTWLNTDIRAGEFFYNIPDEKLWIGTNTVPLELTSSIGNTLADVLANGNATGANDIIVDSGQVIKSSNGGAAISLDMSGLANNIFIATDGIGMEASIEMTPSTFSINNSTGSIALTSAYYISMVSDVKMTSGKSIKSMSGGGRIDLDAYAQPNTVLITTDDAVESESVLYMDPTTMSLSTNGYVEKIDFSSGKIQQEADTINIKAIGAGIVSFPGTVGNLNLGAGAGDIYMASDIQMSSSKSIKSINGGGQIDLDYFSSPGEISISTDNGNQSESYLYLTPTSSDLVGGAGGSISLAGNITFNMPSANKMQIRVGVNGFNIDGRYNASGAESIITFKDNFGSSLTTNNSTKPAILIGSQNSTVSAAISNGIILGGSGHTLGAINSIILGGTGNNLSSTSSIMSGTSNTDSSNSGNIVSGLSNIMNTSYSLLVGCSNTMTNPGIMYSNVNINGTNDLGSNGFSSAGERTTNATPKDLSTYGQFSANSFAIPSNTAYRVHLTVLATDVATGDCKEWEGFGIIKNVAGTTSLVGAGITLTSTFGDVSLATATVAATADNGTDSLKITVTGIAATTINWICGIKYDKIIIA